AEVREMTAPAPAARKNATSRATAAFLSLVRDMDCITPSARAATFTGTTPAAAARPAASRLAALTVEHATEGGTKAEAASCDSTAARVPPDNDRPCRSNRLASMALALARRLPTVPSGRPSWRAASLRDLPAKSHRTIGRRYLSGR